VRDDADLAHIHPITGGESVSRRDAHRHHGARRCDHRFQHVTLVCRRSAQDRVQHDDRGDGQCRQQRQHVRTVRAAVHTELVLDDHHVALVELIGRASRPGWITDHDVRHDHSPARWLRRVEQASHAPVGHPRGRQRVQQRGSEGRQPALGRRVGADETETIRHQGLPSTRPPRHTARDLTREIQTAGRVGTRRSSTRPSRAGRSLRRSHTETRGLGEPAP
jgi:hypothetical protein